MKRLFVIFAACMVIAVAGAQTRRQMGGVYYAYHFEKKGRFVQPVPKGYEPFYISHYGRHGSRWMPSDDRYIWVNSQFEDETNLTPLGKKVKAMLGQVWENARGNGGKLTKLGEWQHREIARRMVKSYPGIFAGEIGVKARSSVVDRCAKSMQAFTSEMHSMRPNLSMDVKTDSADMAWIAYTSAEEKALENRTKVVPLISADRFVEQLFKEPAKLENSMKLMSELHTITSSLQDVCLNFKSYPKKIESTFDALFSENEFESIYNANNRRMTICNGRYILNNGIPARCATSLWQNIEAEADAALAKDKPSATLRFGHDTSLYRLLTLLDMDYNDAIDYIDGYGDDVVPDHMDLLLPMAANLQMIFYKNASGDVLVKFLLNERHGSVTPFSQELKEVYPCFYRWNDIKNFMRQRLHKLEHLRQLTALNTMVGTAQANTTTAGLFGKGSEEHGQTLPAVLVPNGQNFWTPQTQDTEKKCIAPYYYKDSLLQGFRNSHWIVGGCTQDYGSFTVAAISGKLRLQPEERATRFSHDKEISHPHYYAVHLDDEHLLAELTADSHAALLRVTPDDDELVHIVINPNSDEEQGYIEIDTLNHIVYGYNPAHRIYQGWGEPTGFSGHFVLKYYDEMVDYGISKDKNPCLWMTFKGRAHKSMTFAMASSFADKAHALANLNAEVDEITIFDFGLMAKRNADKWIERFHTIDVESQDTSKVNQFYGAFYRASFLPRLFSDAGEKPYYTDFSMWDIFRAQLPLYNIIAPTLSGQMMQSLVDMYSEHGWLPIFPCWNSYTAAMIGDHCAVALADAYIKGVRNFDAEKAYQAMRKNAFERPATYREYEDGMGRRALDSYLKYGYIPMEDSVREAFHTCEQTSRTLEYAFDDFAVAQMAKALGHDADYKLLMERSRNWQNVINPKTGWADGRHADGTWHGCTDLVSRQTFITEGSICHYTWYVPHDIPGLIDKMGGKEKFEQKLDMMFGLSVDTVSRPLYWHGNEPCHQIPFLYNYIGKPEKTKQVVKHILEAEYNDTPGGLSGNDDAGQMSAWYMFSAMGFYPVCPATPDYQHCESIFDKVTINPIRN